MADANGNVKIYPVKLSAAAIGAPCYKRDYESLEFTAEHTFADNFYARASYTWSRMCRRPPGFE